MTAKGTFKYGDRKLPMELGYVLATGKMEDLGFDALSVISDGSQLENLLLNDRLLLKIWYYYVQEQTGDTFEQAIQVLDVTPGGLHDFREAFLELVASFSNPQVRKLIRMGWEEAKRQMNDQQKLKSRFLSSSSQDEQESSQETTP